MTDPKTAGIQRYDCGGPVVPATRGPFVRHEDHLRVIAGLTQERDEARRERDKLRCAMVLAVNQTDSAISDSCSIDFLCQGGEEVAAFAKRLRSERNEAVARADKAEESLALCENLARRLAQGAQAVTADDFLSVLRGES